MNLNNYLDTSALIARKNQLKRIFFYRICGTGMGAAACLLKEAGFDIEGADFNYYPPMSDYLKNSGIPCHEVDAVDESYYKKFDLIVVGNSLAGASKNASFIEELGVPFTSFPECLGALVLKERQVIGVTGTHGKTTTTYFIAQMLEALGEKPGYLIGGVLGNGRPSSALGDSKYFVIESDEYDSAYFKKISKFRLYQINDTILTSLEFDHGDIFNSIEDIEDEFRALFKQDINLVIANSEFESIQKLKKEFSNQAWIDYGQDFKILRESETGSEFEIKINEASEKMVTNLVGTHNLLNLCAAIKYLVAQGFELEQIKKAALKLEHVKRRQEVRGKYKGAIVIDDFAHHPRAVTLTIDGIKKKYPNKKLVTVFEPISSTARSNIFQKEFAESFKETDKLIIGNAKINTTVKVGDNLDYHQLLSDVQSFKVEGRLVDSLEELMEAIHEFIDPNTILLILSNRTCLGLWESEFINELN